MRALLVVNPYATTTSARTREVLVSALEGALKVDVVHTDHRGHAAEVARQARLDGLDLVVTLGGDGTVNEVVNGLLRSEEHTSELQSQSNLVCRLLLEKKKKTKK